MSFNAAWDSPIPAYHFATLLVRSTATRYINCCTIHYISSTLHQQTMDSSLNDAPDSSKTPPKGSRVRIDGLQSAQDLNGAVGIVVDAVDAATGRIPVKLTGQAATSRPDGIKVKPANLSLLPPQRGVRLLGSKAAAVDLSAELLGVTTSKWRSCPVPKLLGIPLSLMQLAPTTHSTRVQWEQPAVLMLMDPKSKLQHLLHTCCTQHEMLWPKVYEFCCAVDSAFEYFSVATCATAAQQLNT